MSNTVSKASEDDQIDIIKGMGGLHVEGSLIRKPQGIVPIQGLQGFGQNRRSIPTPVSRQTNSDQLQEVMPSKRGTRESTLSSMAIWSN